MHCPVCNHEETKVVDSRMSGDGLSIRRRRECEACEGRFSTLEELELLGLTVVKRDGTREPYEREKILRGLERSLEKRSYTDQSFQILLHGVEREIQKRMKSGEITSAEVGEVVMERLRTFDKVAYIRFASVYRSFEDVEQFEQELHALLRKRKPVSSVKRKKRS